MGVWEGGGGLCFFFVGPSHSLGPPFGSGWQRLSTVRNAVRGHFQAKAGSLYVGHCAGFLVFFFLVERR